MSGSASSQASSKLRPADPVSKIPEAVLQLQTTEASEAPPSKKPKTLTWMPKLSSPVAASTSASSTTAREAFTPDPDAASPRQPKPITVFDASRTSAAPALTRGPDAAALGSDKPITAYDTRAGRDEPAQSSRVWRSRDWSYSQPSSSSNQQTEWSSWEYATQSDRRSSTSFQLSRQELLASVGPQTRYFAESLPQEALAAILRATAGPLISNRPNYFANAVRRKAADLGWL